MIKLLNWDSEFFGFRTAQVFMEYALQTGTNHLSTELQNLNIQLLYLFHDLSRPVDNLEKANFVQTSGARLVDTKIVFGRDLSTKPATSLPSSVSEYSPAFATDRLYNIALESGVYSRFRLDPNIPPGSYERMYRLWLDNSLNHKIADVVLVSKDEAGTIDGMVTLSTQTENAVIGLIAVNADARGKGVGSQLMKAAEYYAIEAGKTRLTVATQKANKPACGFYTKSGYDVVSEVDVFHLWINTISSLPHPQSQIPHPNP